MTYLKDNYIKNINIIDENNIVSEIQQRRKFICN